jgi:hypothetical protein
MQPYRQVFVVETPEHRQPEQPDQHSKLTSARHAAKHHASHHLSYHLGVHE